MRERLVAATARTCLAAAARTQPPQHAQVTYNAAPSLRVWYSRASRRSRRSKQTPAARGTQRQRRHLCGRLRPLRSWRGALTWPAARSVAGAGTRPGRSPAPCSCHHPDHHLRPPTYPPSYTHPTLVYTLRVPPPPPSQAPTNPFSDLCSLRLTDPLMTAPQIPPAQPSFSLILSPFCFFGSLSPLLPSESCPARPSCTCPLCFVSLCEHGTDTVCVMQPLQDLLPSRRPCKVDGQH